MVAEILETIAAFACITTISVAFLFCETPSYAEKNKVISVISFKDATLDEDNSILLNVGHGQKAK